jgi:hyperosmotically inducible periplasmic protein
MKTLQLLRGAAVVALGLAAGACNRPETKVDTEQVREEARAAAEQAGEKIADGWLMTKIQAQFFADDDIRARDIAVTARDGVVVLNGFVPDENAHTQAVQIATNTDGVRNVVDQLRIGEAGAGITPPAPGSPVATTGNSASDVAARAAGLLEDAQITSSIQSKYFLDEVVKGRRIDVDTSSGVVTLKGEVASEVERAQALRLARETQGVQRVEDALSVNVNAGTAVPPTAEGAASTIAEKVDDAVVVTKIQARYFLDSEVKAGAVDVTAKDGVVTLEGTVPSRAAKDRAVEMARQTEGVVQVVDGLQVQRPVASTRSQKPATRR